MDLDVSTVLYRYQIKYLVIKAYNFHDSTQQKNAPLEIMLPHNLKKHIFIHLKKHIYQ